MRRWMIVTMLLALAAGSAFALSPLLAGWDIYVAVRDGNRATLDRRVDWPAVRQSLKRTATESRQVIAEMSEASGEADPGIWQRVKTAAAPLVADPLIDRYVTADNAQRLYRWRQTWRQRVRPTIGLKEPDTALHGTWLAGTWIDRAWTVWRRIEHVRFEAPGRVSFEIRERIAERRRWRAALILDGWTWRLTSVEVVRV